MKGKYPTKKDIEKHTNQLVGGIRQYLKGLDKKADFIRNDFNCLFSDLILEEFNTNTNFPKDYVIINFNNFLKKLADTKHLKKNYEEHIKKEIIKELK